MIVSLVRFDFASAFLHNPFLLITGPFIVAYLVYSEWKYIKYGSYPQGRSDIFLWTELGLALIYGILRNIFPI